MQLSPAEVSAEASTRAESSSSASEDVVESTQGASNRAEDQPQIPESPDASSSDSERSEENKKDNDEPEQVSDPRLSLNYVVMQVPASPTYLLFSAASCFY